MNAAIGEGNAGFSGWLDVWCASNELSELWSVEYESMEEPYIKAVEKGRIDPGHEVLQVLTDPLEAKIRQSEGRTYGRMRTSAFPDRAR
jgi:hypothetical protein